MPVHLRTRSLKVEMQPVKEEEQDYEELSVPAPPTSKRRAKTKVELPEPDENKSQPTRNVEEIRRKNLEDNKAFLEGLLMTKIRDDFKSLTNTLQPTSAKKEGKKRDFKYVTVSENVPVRRSRRLANMDVDGNKLPSPEVSDQDTENVQDTSTTVTYQRKTYKRVPDLTPEEQEEINQKIKTFFEQESPSEETTKSTDNLPPMDVTDFNALKLTPDRLTSMDVHSRSDMVAIVGCDRKGTIGLVVKSANDLNGRWAKINYDFHTEYATGCRFDPYESQSIHSISYDATLRTCDVRTNTSVETFKEPNNHGLTAFDYFSFKTLLIAEDNGDVLRMDIRVNPINYDRFDVSKKRLRTLSINPFHGEEFCLAGLDHCVKVYDLRNMSSMKYCLQTGYSCYGAYYNYAGTHIMATSRDDHVASFSSDDMKQAADPMNIQPVKRIYHRNYVNRFVTPFTAQPYALCESQFLIGSNGNPRAVTILDDHCTTVNSLTSENLNSLATVNVSHRTLPILVAGNSSGRIHVFTGQM